MIPICLTVLVMLGCSETKNDICTGWQPITPTEETAKYLEASDRQTLERLIAHFEYGLSLNCW